MCLKVEHKFEGVTTPCIMQDAVTGRILLQTITATVGARVGTASTARVWCITTITRWLVVILVVLGRLLLRSLQVNGTLVRLFSLEQGSLTSTACHEFELSFINKVLKVHTRVKLDVHRLDVLLAKLLQRLRTLTVDGDAKDTKLTEFNLVAVEQLLYNAVAHVRQDGFHHTAAVASVV